MSSSVEKIKERLSITDVVSSYLKLEKAGASFRAKCPFHNEKSPSFFVSPDRGTYYCFGCGAKGDIFTFVEEFEGLEFKQALTNLAAKAGVELVPERAGERNEKERLYRAVEEAVEFFERELPDNHPVLAYLEKRGLSAETIKSWRIGYAKNEWRALREHLKKSGVTDQEMIATGLIKRSDRADAAGGEQFYDVFRGRIMFPIFDSSGRPVAFSGRIFVDDEKSPKYLNSPATALFNKSEVLYGFDRAKTAIRKMNYAILVEGQMDLIMSHQAGLTNTVASSGTALTETHLRRLQRISPRIMFAFDSDSAGFNATKRSAELALQIGMEVKVAVLPAGDDPASLVVKDPNLWKQALKNGKHIIDFYTDSLIARKLDRRVLSREIKAEVLPFILRVESKTEQAHFIKSIAEKSGLKEDALWDDVKSLAKFATMVPSMAASAGNTLAGGTKTGSNPSVSASSTQSGAFPATRLRTIEQRAMGVVWWQESLKDKVATAASIRKRMIEILSEPRVEELETEFIGDREKLTFEAEQYYERSTKFREDVKELFSNLEEEYLKELLNQKTAELYAAERDKMQEQSEKFLKECHEIMNRLAVLRKRNEQELKDKDK